MARQSSPHLFAKESPRPSASISGITWEERILVRHRHTPKRTQMIPKTTIYSNCLYFAGSLTLYMKPAKGERVKIFSSSQNQGDVWRHGNGNITSTLVDWQVRCGGWREPLEQLETKWLLRTQLIILCIKKN